MKFIRYNLTKNQEIELFNYKPFQIYFIEKKIPDRSNVGVQSLGSFIDLCAGPHLPSTGWVKSFKLIETSGFIWQGDASGTPLQRVYGISFPSQDLMDQYIKQEQEKSQRDHRKVGKDLYFWSPFSAGSAFFLPDVPKFTITL